MVRLIIALLVLTFALSFNSYSQTREVPKDWKEIKMCGLSFLVPKYLKEQKIQPIDSCIGEFKGKNIRLGFDYGWYTADFETRPPDRDAKVETLEIDGKKAMLAISPTGIRLYILVAKDVSANGNSTTALGMGIGGKKQEDVEIARRIIQSIRFVKEN